MIELQIPTANGFLTGVLHKPSRSTDYKQTLIMCHGFRGSKEGGGRAVRLAEMASALGLHVVRFDFTPASMLTLQIAELAVVIDYVRQNVGDKIWLLGRSMGGSAALAYAADSGGIAGLCLWATPWGLAETFQLALGENYVRLERGEQVSLDDEYGRIIITPDFIADFNKYDLLGSARRLQGIPLLQVHGDSDAVVPLKQAYDIHNAALVYKKMVIIQGGDHHLTEHAEAASSAVIDWLRTVI